MTGNIYVFSVRTSGGLLFNYAQRGLTPVSLSRAAREKPQPPPTATLASPLLLLPPPEGVPGQSPRRRRRRGRLSLLFSRRGGAGRWPATGTRGRARAVGGAHRQWWRSAPARAARRRGQLGLQGSDAALPRGAPDPAPFGRRPVSLGRRSPRPRLGAGGVGGCGGQRSVVEQAVAVTLVTTMPGLGASLRPDLDPSGAVARTAGALHGCGWGVGGGCCRRGRRVVVWCCGRR